MKDKISELIANYAEQLKNYKKLLLITKRQKEIIENKDMGRLNDLIKKKENIIGRINELQNENHPTREKIAEEYEVINNEDFLVHLLEKDFSGKKKLKSVIEKILKMILKVQKLDGENLEILKKKKLKIKEDLQELSKGKELHSSYTMNSMDSSEGKFIDNKG